MNNAKNEIATCACGAHGEIVKRSHHLAVEEKWFVIKHEHGEEHTVEVFWSGEAFRFRMVKK